MIALNPTSPLHLSNRTLRAFLLIPLLLLTTGSTVVGIADNNAFAGFNPGSILSLGKLNPSLLGSILTGAEHVNVLIETRSHDYAAVVADITRLGGQVTYQYKYVRGLAATVPGGSLFQLAQNPEVLSIDPDATLTMSNSLRGIDSGAYLESLAGSAIMLNEPFEILDNNVEALGGYAPDTYINTVTHGAMPLINQNIRGQSSIAGIIDTGIYSGHFMLRGKVVGGADVSTDVGTGFEGFDDVRNHWHGSAVAGVLGGFARILVSSDSLLVRSIELHSGMSLPAGPVSGTKILTLSGIAPATTFFVIKVFPHDGSGASTARVVRAMEVAIDVKVSGQFDIDIISMSLGGATLFDGRGIDGQAVDLAVSHGISVSIAAGNEGPAPITVADPGASNAAITSAALAHPINTRVLWDLNFGILGIGNSLFVGDDPQIISFSSRGPTADGRAKPDVSSIGVFTLAPFPCAIFTLEGCSPNRGQGLAFVSGTSFSTPATSGVISLLNDHVERVLALPDGATPQDIKNAIVSSANPIPGYTAAEQGAGFVHAADARAALVLEGSTPAPLPPIPQGTPLTLTADIRNLFLANLPTDPVRSFTTTLTLNPGQNVQYVFETVRQTDTIRVRFTDVSVGVNPNPTAQAAFPNSFEVYIHDSKRGGSGGGFGYYIDSLNVRGNAEFVIREASTTFSGDVFGLLDPSQRISSTIEPGFGKVVIEGDWTNGVPVSATITIEVTASTPPTPTTTHTGTVGQFDFATGAGLVVLGPFNLRRGSVLKLYWTPGDYAHFPASDVDLILAKGPVLDTGDNFQGATLNSPERTVVLDSGRFFVLIMGFEINPPGATENWELQIFA